MNPALKMAAPKVAEGGEWQKEAPCSAFDPEFFFDHAERDPDVEQIAKDVCATCPVRQKCLDRAMLNDEQYGIWGGLNPAERTRHRAAWERNMGGRGVVRAMRERNGILIHDPSIDRRYSARLKAAQECRQRAIEAGSFHRRDEYMAVLELIIAHPTEDSGRLAHRVGFSKAWFNTMKREVYDRFGIKEVYEGEVA